MLVAGTIVTGGRGAVGRVLMSSVSDSVIRHAHCPVFAGLWQRFGVQTKFLLITDGPADANFATRPALDLGDRTGSQPHVIYVMPGPKSPSETS
jgi:hypothetical protein